MKKSFLAFLLLFILGSTTQGKGLKDSTKFYFNISSGTSVPFGDFGSKKQSTLSVYTINGFAKAGFDFKISTDWYVFYHFGITASASGIINTFDSKDYNSSLNFGEQTNTTANNFYLQEYLLGFCYRFNLTPKISMHTKAMVGYIETNYPTINVSFPATVNQSSGSDLLTFQGSNAFLSTLDLGGNYHFQKHMSFLVDLSYSTANINYPNYSLSQNLEGNPTLSISQQGPFYMSLALLETTIGITFSF